MPPPSSATADTQPPPPYCGCQRSVKSINTTGGWERLDDLFTLECPAPPRKGSPYFNHLSFNLTSQRGVLDGTWPLLKGVLFPDAVVETGPLTADGTGYSWVLEFQCVQLKGQIAFVGINFYSRVISDATFRTMLAAATARGLPAYWNGTYAGNKGGVLQMVNHTGCAYPPPGSETAPGGTHLHGRY